LQGTPVAVVQEAVGAGVLAAIDRAKNIVAVAIAAPFEMRRRELARLLAQKKFGRCRLQKF
jgi:hypothetical protein